MERAFLQGFLIFATGFAAITLFAIAFLVLLSNVLTSFLPIG